MSSDTEVQTLRAEVPCTAVLENLIGGWALDRQESTHHALKYRRGEGEVLIVNHDGRGWWDPMSDAKGDVFTLVQHLDPSLNFGQVRQVLRKFIGLTPTYAAHLRREHETPVKDPPAERWAKRPRVRPYSPSWLYLIEKRALPQAVVNGAAARDAIREGPYGSVWFAHRRRGHVSHVDIRGPMYKGSLSGGEKTLFCFTSAQAAWSRLVITEAPIDALSVAALENIRPDTLYAATSGGMGAGTLDALSAILAKLASIPDARVVSATDADTVGDHYVARHQEMAAKAGVAFARLRPAEGKDWNDILRQGRGA